MARHRNKAKPRPHNAAGVAEPGRTRGEVILYCIAMLLALVGIADATYLTASHLAGETAACIAAAGCSDVLGSSYAKVGGVPLAALGALAYFSAFSAATLALFGYPRARSFLMAIVALMFVTTLWLLYVMAFVLKAYCDYCLLSAALTFALAGIVIVTPPRK
jgi:uncharacterized membrane protein